MESARDSGSSVDFRTGAATNSGENFNSGTTSELTSKDHFHFMPNATTTTHDQAYLLSDFHNTYSVTEKRDRSTIDSRLEAHPTNLFGEAHPSPLQNNSAPSSLSPSSQNPFLLPTDTTNNTHVSAGVENSSFVTYPDGSLGETYHAFSGEMVGMHSSLEQSSYESSSGNPFEVQKSNTPLNGASISHIVDDNHDHKHESHHKLPAVEQGDWSMPGNDAWTRPTNTLGETHVPSSSQQQLDPLFTLEGSAQNQKLANATDKTHEGATAPIKVESHHSMASSNLGADTDTVPGEASVSSPDKQLGSSESPFSPASKSSTKDPMHNSINAASNSQTSTNAPPKLGMDSKLAVESSHDDDIPINSMPKHGQKSSDPGTNNGSQIQNPPVQVMERPGDPAASSNYRIPSHVFSRNRSNTQWSTASNESLFSIQMGNMSFSREMSWFSKSGELEKPNGGDMCMPGAFPSNQPPLPPQPQPPASKFSDMSQRTAEQHEGSRATEEKAAETMREVIMEESLRKGNLSVADGAPHFSRHSNSNDHSNHSNGSTRSFAFKVLTDGDRTPKRVEEKLKQQKQSEQQTITKETPNAAQTTKSTISASSQNRWLSCFTCCQ